MYDVVVLGGGPAGSAAAITCARAGLRVAILERDASRRHRPGETLHPGVEPLFQQLGVWERVLACNFLRHEGAWVAWGDAPRFEPFGGNDPPWRGFQAWRPLLDEILLDEARARGVDIVRPVRAKGVLREGARVVGIATDAGLFRGRWMIDAAGGSHWLAKRLGVKVRLRSPRLIAKYGYAKGECPARDDAPRIAAHPSGWTWTARVRPSLYAWTRLSLDQPSSSAVPAELSTLETTGAAAGADVTWRMAERVAGAGYFLAGDAGSVLDPASSHGILKAIMSGMLAARRIVDVVRRGASETAATSDYHRWIADWFEHDVKRLTRLYAIFPAWRGAHLGLPSPRLPAHISEFCR